jgi:hypothetical protein
MGAHAAHRGDSHNFGRRVVVRGAWVHKPRTLLWEWLLLSGESPLRTLLRRAAEDGGLGASAFDFLPDLAFRRPRARKGGDVERLELAPLRRLSAEETRELARIVGRSLALWSWLGVEDLHWENLALGRATGGRIVLAPIDVELILADLASPAQTRLLPEPDAEYGALYQHACGVRRALPWLGKPLSAELLVTMVAAYARTLAFLEARRRDVAATLARVPGLHDAPIRVTLRSTGDYLRARTEELWPPLLCAEREQLERGDVPYFFRLQGRRGIHWYADRSLRTFRTLPVSGDVPRLGPLLSLAKGLSSPSRRALREEGLFIVLGAFDHPTLTGVHRADGLEVAFRRRSLVVKGPGGEELETRRDLSDFVSPVYLPCRCGEVRTPLVPRRTRCERVRGPEGRGNGRRRAGVL